MELELESVLDPEFEVAWVAACVRIRVRVRVRVKVSVSVRDGVRVRVFIWSHSQS